MTPPANLSPKVLDAIRLAVNLARDHEIPNVKMLQNRMRREGVAEEDIKAAIQYWAAHVQRSAV